MTFIIKFGGDLELKRLDLTWSGQVDLTEATLRSTLVNFTYIDNMPTRVHTGWANENCTAVRFCLMQNSKKICTYLEMNITDNISLECTFNWSQIMKKISKTYLK